MFTFSCRSSFSSGSHSYSSGSHSYSSGSGHSYSTPARSAPAARVAAPAKAAPAAKPAPVAKAAVAPKTSSKTVVVNQTVSRPAQQVVVVNHYNTVYQSSGSSFWHDYFWYKMMFGSPQQAPNYQGQPYGSADQQGYQTSTMQSSYPAQPVDHSLAWGISGGLAAGILLFWLLHKIED